MKLFQKYLVYYLLIFAIGCNIFTKKETGKTELLQALVLIYLNISGQEFNNKLYKYVAGIPGSTPSAFQFVEPTSLNKTSKTKIVLIHGWDFDERTSDPTTSDEEKVANILETWETALKFYDSNTSSVQDKYDFYTFTYRTANSIEFNGHNFIQHLNKTFVHDDKVIILAHSMGGLVTKTAVYDSKNSQDVIDYVISLGTPYYGSPFASKEYQENIGIIGDLANFLTDTNGGQNLAYTSNGDGQIFIEGAKNDFLDSLNDYTNKDSIFYAYVGVLSDCNNAKSGTIFQKGCTTLQSGTPAFSESDGIVPKNSAQMSNKLSNNVIYKTDFDHRMLSFNIASDTSLASEFFSEVIAKIDSL